MQMNCESRVPIFKLLLLDVIKSSIELMITSDHTGRGRLIGYHIE